MRDANETKVTGFNRRNAIKLATAGAAAVTGAFGIERASAQGTAGTGENGNGEKAGADRAAKTSPGWSRVELGQARITPVLDGMRPGEGPYPTFGMDQSQEAMGELMAKNLLPEKRFVNMFNPTLVELDDNLILFDTGFGESGAENGFGKLVENMADAGYGPNDVTIVVLTHFHGDHIQGLMTGGAPTFPNARYVAGRKEYDWWTSEEAKNGERAGNAKLVEKLVVPLADKMTFVSDGDEVVAGITAMDAFGHTPGHMIFEISSDGQRLMMTGDTANHFVASLQKPDWNVSFDQDHETANATRKRVFDRIAEERLPFIGYHMPFPAVGYVEKMEDGGYRFVPHTYQLAVPQDA